MIETNYHKLSVGLQRSLVLVILAKLLPLVAGPTQPINHSSLYNYTTNTNLSPQKKATAVLPHAGKQHVEGRLKVLRIWCTIRRHIIDDL